MQASSGNPLKDGLRLALVLMAAVSMFLGAVSGATWVALSGMRSGATTTTTDVQGAKSESRSDAPQNDNHDPAHARVKPGI